MAQLTEKHVEKIKFTLVGGANTALDFGILFILVFFLGTDKIIANYLSTSIALIFSFFANRSFTFKHSEGSTKRQFILFITITLFGLWVLQPIIISVYSISLTPYIKSDAINLLMAKMVATIISLIWNYFLYSRFVFKKGNKYQP